MILKYPVSCRSDRGVAPGREGPLRPLLAALRVLLLVPMGVAALAPVQAHCDRRDGKVSYFRQIRPILQTRCQGCHQPASIGGKLLLVSYADFAKGGDHGPAFVKGSPDASPVIGYLNGKPELMPQNGMPLPPEQIALFRRWIAQGAQDDTPADTGSALPPPSYTAPPVITALAYSADGRMLAVSGYREVLLNRADGSGLIARLVGRSQKVLSLAFAPDGKTLAAVGGSPAQFGEVQFWNVADDHLIRSVMVSYDTLFGASFSPDGRQLGFGGADNSVRVITVPDGKPVMRLDNHSDWVFGTVFSTDGKSILSVSRDQAIKLTQVDSGSFIDDINTHYTPLRCLARRAGMDQVMCVGDDGIPRLYKIFRTEVRTMNQEDHNLIRAYDRQSGAVICVAFSPDGAQFAVGTETGSVNVYQVEDGRLVASLSGARGGVYAVAFRPDGRQIVTGGFDGMVRLYALPSGALAKAFSPVPIQAPKPARSPAAALR